MIDTLDITEAESDESTSTTTTASEPTSELSSNASMTEFHPSFKFDMNDVMFKLHDRARQTQAVVDALKSLKIGTVTYKARLTNNLFKNDKVANVRNGEYAVQVALVDGVDASVINTDNTQYFQNACATVLDSVFKPYFTAFAGELTANSLKVDQVSLNHQVDDKKKLWRIWYTVKYKVTNSTPK